MSTTTKAQLPSTRSKLPSSPPPPQKSGLAPALRPGPSSPNLMALHAAYGNGAVARAFSPRRASPPPVRPESRALSPQPSAGSSSPAAEAGPLQLTPATDRQPEAAHAPAPPRTRSTPPNTTGLPDGLKSGIEALSGISMDGVNVDYNSPQPAQLNALAYAQGRDIHVAPGQERHLPHEAWHVVQQAQGRVKPTMQMKDGVPVNDDEELEHEADVKGAEALAHPAQRRGELAGQRPLPKGSLISTTTSQVAADVVQTVTEDGTDYTNAEKREAIEHARQKVTKKNAKDSDYAKAMVDYLTLTEGQATRYKDNAALQKACKDWWNRPSQVEEPVAAAQPRGALENPRIEYDEGHGDLHFIPKPNKKKSAWDLEKADAQNLMVTEIQKHLTALGVHSAEHERDGWSAFYITAQHESKVGSYVGPLELKKFPTTNYFTIQVQVNYNENLISYHGFPDEKIEGFPLGCSFNKNDRVKLGP